MEEIKNKTARLYVSLEDKIGFPGTYSSATAAASISREVEDVGGDEALPLLQAELKKMAEEVLEPFIAAERENILRMIKEKRE